MTRAPSASSLLGGGLALALACTPKPADTTGAASTGDGGSDGSTTAGAATSTTLDLTSTTGTTTDDTSTTGASTTSPDETSSSTTGEPLGPCAERRTPEACNASPSDASPACLWASIAPWKLGDACPELDASPACIDATYAGEGCVGSGCTIDFLYYREVAPGEFEFLHHLGKCGHEPTGWTQCVEPFDPPCACLCAGP